MNNPGLVKDGEEMKIQIRKASAKDLKHMLLIVSS
jgi:hypothetical protein